MTSYLRRITQQVTYGTDINNLVSTIPSVLSIHASLGIDQRVAACEFEVPFIPSDLTYDRVVQVTMGAIGSNPVVRFTGIVRDFRYKLNPRTITVVCYGFLRRAIEFENTEDPTIIGGLIPMDLTSNYPKDQNGFAVFPIAISSGTGQILTQFNPVGYTDTAANIIAAVLTKCGVPFQRGNINSSEIQFGLFEDAFVWNNGTNSENFDLREAGEQGLTYIERYDEVDGDHNGRYRTYEDPVHDPTGGTFRTQMIMPPTGIPDIPAFTETIDVLDGEITRSISATRNYFAVTGYDTGAGAGPEFFVLQTSNPFQFGDTKHTAHLSSSMIERSLDTDAGSGQSCETVANALASELNREIVSGWVETFRDDPVGPLTKIQVSGNGGLPDRLGTGQLLYVIGLDIIVDAVGFTQRFTVIG